MVYNLVDTPAGTYPKLIAIGPNHTRTSPAGHGGAAGHGEYSTERCGGPKKLPGTIEAPARGPPHVCYKGENRDLPKMVSTLIFTF